ncbi:P-loop containing nucleoside triphosphate hydrolase protein [Rhodofomes roseus]|uniref:P-loop containing nucleoside triphosphate hydrolase protein n=1 Tax=Rhodofomes roseus TaxID=34475 RepID=A0ABQ8JZ33_9APHY|nr:P-loop containing nucleoside triphosphate hydrolase protein [Rhodofomes roseus]KAH9829558.1 P-loop containing nucleoside triphosphate hydrolase protein [Rhodofomes roseus]
MFELDGTPWRRRHRANNLTRKAAHQRRLLFPDINYILGLRRLTDAEIDTIDLEEDNSLLSNREQKETIAKIVTEPPGSVPFIIFGPPGTGKTLTVAKAALQLLKRKPDVRLLMCAPTNEAADLLAYKMMELGPTQLFRLNAPGRPVDSDTKLRAALKDFSVTKDDKYGIPDLDRLQSYRVVVATCASAAIPYLLQIERGWFTHIFVDEASQCTEPDTMIPLKLLADQKTNIILAGDFKQLGPVIHSSLASDFGLKHSYMERLSDLPIYDLKDYGGVTIIKLLNHFRSHPAIIGFSNQHFYDNELKLCGDEAITHSMLDSDVLDGLNPKFPVVFHAVKGREVQKGHSPSYFNMPEAMLVSRYCEMLINDTNCPITAQEIGIISPYSAQCHKIRALLKQSPMDTDALRIGSTEQFQGQDYRVIIISTVRSNQKRADRDIRQRLGFVADPRRFNVATTRARSLLVVIGDPDVLALDDVWREFMVYVKANGGWRGKFVSGSYGNGCNAGFEGETGGEGAVDQ